MYIKQKKQRDQEKGLLVEEEIQILEQILGRN